MNSLYQFFTVGMQETIISGPSKSTDQAGWTLLYHTGRFSSWIAGSLYPDGGNEISEATCGSYQTAIRKGEGIELRNIYG